MPRKPYFKQPSDAPPPIEETVVCRARFEDCDPLGIVWHGRYTSYFEDARVALCERQGIGYMDFYRQDVLIPLKQMFHEYISPIRFNQQFNAKALLHWDEAARLNFEYQITDLDGNNIASGYTVHMMLSKEFELLLTPPQFYQEFQKRWKQTKGK